MDCLICGKTCKEASSNICSVGCLTSDLRRRKGGVERPDNKIKSKYIVG